MAIEIERRFLVEDLRAAMLPGGLIGWQRIIQGYFGRAHGLSRRIRIFTGLGGRQRAALTLKSPRCARCRLEFEYPLALDVARRALRSVPKQQIIRKIRYQVRHHDGLVWSVDRFQGANAGLVLAEVELSDPQQPVELPTWVGAEITLEPRYGNSRLARSPISKAPLAPAA